MNNRIWKLKNDIRIVVDGSRLNKLKKLEFWIDIRDFNLLKLIKYSTTSIFFFFFDCCWFFFFRFFYALLNFFWNAFFNLPPTECRYFVVATFVLFCHFHCHWNALFLFCWGQISFIPNNCNLATGAKLFVLQNPKLELGCSFRLSNIKNNQRDVGVCVKALCNWPKTFLTSSVPEF